MTCRCSFFFFFFLSLFIYLFWVVRGKFPFHVENISLKYLTWTLLSYGVLLCETMRLDYYYVIGKIIMLINTTFLPSFWLSYWFSFPGMSESEQALKGTSQIKLLSSEDIEGMRLVCRVRVIFSPWDKIDGNGLEVSRHEVSDLLIYKGSKCHIVRLWLVILFIKLLLAYNFMQRFFST